jgi:hypothetical protein
VRYFPGKDLPWLKSRLDSILEQEAVGGRVRSTGAGDTSAELLLEDIDATKRKLLHDLSIVNPSGFPACDVLIPTRTRVSFT